jgi:alpha/beta superfamily hydrolase
MFLLGFIAKSQLAYTANIFNTVVETDIEYGIVENFAGINDTLLMDIYKPIGDNNCNRPCLVLIHGGAWVGGSKNDVSIVSIANSFAEKGWVVSTINYRLGTHKTSNYNMYAVCNNTISQPCGYICDSAEIFRANYRGQQDAKGAIRFMKNRAVLDSTDISNVFITGESAGAFVAYAATFLDKVSEKSPFCLSIADAPTPDGDVVYCLPTGYSLARPDLGDINGTLNLGQNNSSVQGVGSFYGAMMDFDMVAGDTEWPVVYMFHQGSDIVVNYNYGRILGRTDWECYAQTNICQQYAKYPKAHGSKSIENYFSSLSIQPVRKVEIIENYEYLNDCFDNGHSIDNWVNRSDSMAVLFANRVLSNGNTPTSGPCDLSEPNKDKNEFNIKIFPNPGNNEYSILNAPSGSNLFVYSFDGKLVQKTDLSTNSSFYLSNGLYIIQIRSIDGQVLHIEKLISK